MKKMILIFLMSLVFFACGGEGESSEDNTTDTDTTTVDTLVASDTIQINVDPNRPEIDLDKLLAKAEQTFELPLTVDSVFIEKHTTDYTEGDKYNMTLQEAKYLSFDFVKDNVTGNNEYDVTNFIFMDSLRQGGKKVYQQYQDALDIGMTRYSIANVIGKVDISDISFLLLWHTDYATYEACPYGSGKCVYATLFTKNTPTNTVLVGEESGGGDPPLWGDTRVSSIISAEAINIKSRDIWGDEDFETGEEIIETSERESDIEISPYGMVCTGNKGE